MLDYAAVSSDCNRRERGPPCQLSDRYGRQVFKTGDNGQAPWDPTPPRLPTTAGRCCNNVAAHCLRATAGSAGDLVSQ